MPIPKPNPWGREYNVLTGLDLELHPTVIHELYGMSETPELKSVLLPQEGKWLLEKKTCLGNDTWSIDGIVTLYDSNLGNISVLNFLRESEKS